MEAPFNHAYQYPTVIEIKVYQEPSSADTFGQKNAMETIELGPIQKAHWEQHLNSAELMVQNAQQNLARLSLLYSGQLQFDFEQGDEV